MASREPGAIKAVLLGLIIAVCTAPSFAQKVGLGKKARKPLELATVQGCWKLVRDTVHPAGPGKWLRVPGSWCSGQKEGQGGSLAENAGPPLAVRAGESLIVEDHAGFAEAHLQAVAIEPAHQGATVQARLLAGGAVVRAVVLGPGRAVLDSQARVRP